jgi:hypothetical protein
MSVLDRVREKFKIPMSGTSKSSKGPSAGFAGSAPKGFNIGGTPSAGSAGSSHTSFNSASHESPYLDPQGLPLDQCPTCGCPSWWTSHVSPGWHCASCTPRPEPFMQGRIVVVAGGEWLIH